MSTDKEPKSIGADKRAKSTGEKGESHRKRGRRALKKGVKDTGKEGEGLGVKRSRA